VPSLVKGYEIFNISPTLVLGSFSTFFSNLKDGAVLWPKPAVAFVHHSAKKRSSELLL